jgi:tetratricopeptide (TPR) repeat protein
LGERWFPDNRYIWNNRGVLNRDWGRFDEAIAAFERALEIDPEYSRALEGRSEALLLRGNFADAVTGFRSVVEKHPNQAETWRNLAMALAGAGKRETSIKTYERSLALAPNDTKTLFDYAGVLAQAGRYGDAIATLDRLLELNGEDSEARKWREQLLTSPITTPDIQPPSIPRANFIFRLLGLGRSQQELDRLAGLVEASITSGKAPPATPPKLFISYRWAKKEQDAWVGRFANALESRGYDVIFDRRVQSKASNPLPVPDLIGLMVGCTHFVPILTEGYRRRVETRPENVYNILEDGWVWDEYQVALRLGAARRITFRGVWLGGWCVEATWPPS